MRKYKAWAPLSMCRMRISYFLQPPEYRRSLGTHYPYGEMFVILNQPPESASAAHYLENGSRFGAEDATKKLIKELKLVRGR
ncbi:MAG: hypothetical protein WKF30_15750 [Pyrinomonadaceae bacterium]